MKNFDWNNTPAQDNCSLFGNNISVFSVILCIIGGFFLSSGIFAVLGAALFELPILLKLLLWIVCTFLLGFLFE